MSPEGCELSGDFWCQVQIRDGRTLKFSPHANYVLVKMEGIVYNMVVFGINWDKLG